MSSDEIEVPLGVREFMPHWIEETSLGNLHGADKQYRHGTLHIRKYDDRYMVHVDSADPRREPLQHLIHDAPEVLAALSIPVMAYASYKAASWLERNK